MKRLNNNSIDFSFSFATKYLNLCRMCSAKGNWKYLKGMYLINLISLVKEIIGIYTQSMYTLFDVYIYSTYFNTMYAILSMFI